MYTMSAAAILKLQASGFTSEQVSALAELIDTQAATKADVEAAEHRLELKISDLKASTQAEISDLKASTKSDIESVKSSLQADNADTKADVRVLKWMMGFVLAFQVAIFIKMFLPTTIH
jgi:methionine-rich copper-binding protein CopC